MKLFYSCSNVHFFLPGWYQAGVCQKLTKIITVINVIAKKCKMC